MVLNESWKYGSKSWSMEDGYIIEKASKQVIDSEYENLKGNDVILSDKQANKISHKWEEVKLDADWMKLKNPVGLFLHVSEDGEKLTIEEDSKGKVHFYLKL